MEVAQKKEKNIRPIRFLLVKLAMRCNIKCSYCYWFEDKGVYDKPATMNRNVFKIFLEKLNSHIQKYSLKDFHIAFHGGEPLLVGKKIFDSYCFEISKVFEELKCGLKISLTTNGMLIDQEWSSLFKKYRISVTVSLDGPQEIHDGRRVSFIGNGTFNKVVDGISCLRENGIEPGILAVCDPTSNPKRIIGFFADELKVKWFDVLVPDSNHTKRFVSISDYYTNLFDLWYDKYSMRDIEIRFIKSVVRGLLGRSSKSESIGYGEIVTACLLTDGTLEPLDVLKIGGGDRTDSSINIFSNEIQDITNHLEWKSVRKSSLLLPKSCQSCEFWFACGGGHIASRWSEQNCYDNPSVYCEDLKKIFHHVKKRISPDIYVEVESQRNVEIVSGVK